MNKTVYMDYGDLVGNLVILFKNNNVNMNKISFSLVDKYTSILINNIKENGFDFYIQEGYKEIDDLFEDHKEYFKRNKETNTIDIIKEPSFEYLYAYFRSGIPCDAYGLFNDKKILIELLQSYRDEVKEEYDKKMLKINNKILKLVMSETDEYRV